MKIFLLFTLFTLFAVGSLQAQTLDELKAKKADLEAQRAAKQAEADAFNGEIASLAGQIEILSGWQKGFNGSVGFNLNNSFNWIANPNTDARSTGLNIGLTAFANRKTEKYFWNNKGIVTKAWQDIDLNDADRDNDDDGLFDNGTIDIVNISSLYGYKLNDKIAISGLGELNTSIENFLKPGTLDFGVGATWTPADNFVVVVHPFNYRVAFPADGNELETTGAVGAKLRADYTRAITLAGKEIAWSSTLTSFIPYQEKDPTLFEYTWLNTLNFNIYKGIGVAVGFGLRNAEFESEDLQGYLNLGLSYGF
ncbi:MAG: DUF3078 domain-containing protein [Bacteroidota bacterium]